MSPVVGNPGLQLRVSRVTLLEVGWLRRHHLPELPVVTHALEPHRDGGRIVTELLEADCRIGFNSWGASRNQTGRGSPDGKVVAEGWVTPPGTRAVNTPA